MSSRALARTANIHGIRCCIRSYSDTGTQVTLALLKPDLLANEESVRCITKEIQQTPNIEIVLQKRIHWSREEAERFYEEHRGRFFFNRLVGYMTSGPIEALALRGPNAILKWREMLGKTHPVRVRLMDKGCLRARYGLTDTRNSFHGSDSNDSAKRELSFVFGESAYSAMCQ